MDPITEALGWRAPKAVEIARACAVSPQAVSKWTKHGVPVRHVPTVLDLLDADGTLARRALAHYGGMSIAEAREAAGDPSEALRDALDRTGSLTVDGLAAWCRRVLA